MHKSTARGEQFFSRTGNESTKGSRKGYSILGGGEDVVAQLTPEQIRNNKVTRLKWLRTLRNNTGLTLEEENEKRQLDKEVRALEKEINAKKPRDLSHHFTEVCRELLPREQFYKLLDMAREREKRESANQQNNNG